MSNVAKFLPYRSEVEKSNFRKCMRNILICRLRLDAFSY